MATKNTGNNTTKRRGNPQNLALPWKPGQSGNPSGRKLGARNRKTVIMEALERIATFQKLDPVELEDAIQAAGITKAIKGSYFHYEAISDGLYGKITDKMDLRSGGKTLADLIAAAAVSPAHAKRGGKSKTKVQG